MRMPQVFRSPFLWGGVAIAGVILYRHRKAILRGAGVGASAGPAPVLVERNPARSPSPSRIVRQGERKLIRYDAHNFSIDERLKLIQEKTWEGVHDPSMRELAGKLTRGCGRDDGPCEAKRIFEGVKAKVRYTGDIGPVKNPKTGEVEPIDMYQSPAVTWKYGIGDCDDATALIASLLAVIGHTVRLRVTAPTKTSDWAHIYPVTLLPKTAPKKALSVDITLPGVAGVGTEARYGKARDYTIEAPV